jgi:hypothetical protein
MPSVLFCAVPGEGFSRVELACHPCKMGRQAIDDRSDMGRPPLSSRYAALRYDWFLYLVAELERAIENASDWDAASVKTARERLNQVAARMHQVPERREGQHPETIQRPR